MRLLIGINIISLISLGTAHFENEAILGAEEAEKAVVVDVEVHHHLIDSEPCHNVVLDCFCQFFTFFPERAFAGLGSAFLLEPLEDFVDDEWLGELHVHNLLVNAFEEAEDLPQANQFLDVDAGEQFAVELDHLMEDGDAVELEVEAEELLGVHWLAHRHCACDFSELAVARLFGEVVLDLGGEGVAVVEAEQVQQEHHSLLAGSQVELPHLWVLSIAVAVQPAYLAQRVGAFQGILQQLPPKLTLHSVYFLLGEEGDWYGGGREERCVLGVGGRAGVDEGVVAAEVREVAVAVVVDLGAEVGEDGAQVLGVPVLVDHPVHLFDDPEEAGEREHCLLVERALLGLQEVLLGHQDARRVDEDGTVVGVALRDLRAGHQVVLVKVLHRQRPVTQLLPRLDQPRVQREQLHRQRCLHWVAHHQSQPQLLVEVGQERPQDPHPWPNVIQVCGVLGGRGQGRWRVNHLSVRRTRLQVPMTMQSAETKGERRSPMTAALRTMPRKPVLCGSMKVGVMLRKQEAVQMNSSTTMIMLSKLKNAL